MIYGVISDTHCHNWSTFSEVGSDYVNNRLQIILNEILRAATEVKKSGGEYLIHTGDLFHVRGSVSPSVLNPTLETFRKIIDMGIKPIILCGNHDAEFRITTDVGSAISSLRAIGCEVINEPTTMFVSDENFVFIPWEADTDEFMEAIYNQVGDGIGSFTLFCHVALDGVFARLSPKSIVDHKKLLEMYPNIKFIFAGHLHNHKKIGHNCYSVGAIAQHNWGESDSKAGFLIVDSEKKKVTFRASRAPKFVELTPDIELEDIPALVDGNYVRASVEMNESEIKEYRQLLKDYGAAGVSIIANPKPIVRADRVEVNVKAPLIESVSAFINKRYGSPMKEKLLSRAEEILGEE